MAGKKRGPKPGFKMTQEHRDKIANSNILSRLIRHAEGREDMSATEVTATLGLMKKYLPDLSATDITSGGETVEQPTVINLRAKPVRKKHDD